ncbi:DUF1919 domain-containing protein [Cellvibrio sp.]|uniref:DUF1919 domain-containing protein n=1 Tax=Cellvibrio sp. TaxID=1965322 RepID=UPI00396486C8
MTTLSNSNISSARAWQTRRVLQKIRDGVFSTYELWRLKQTPFVIISNNCWGYELYSSTRREYNTPFIGLFMKPESYLKFLEGFDKYISAELNFVSQSKQGLQPKPYPVGTLGDDIEIHFLHYASEKEAREKWNRRVSRLKLALESGAELYVKLCDCENCTTGQLARFHKLPFKNKLSIGLLEFKHTHHLQVPNLRNKDTHSLIDGARLFKKRYSYFDITGWLRTGKIKRSFVSRTFSLIS